MPKLNGIHFDAIQKKQTVREQKEYFGKVASLGCIICSQLGYETTDCGCELHHVRTGNIPRKNAPVIPLCFEHHRGNTGIHGLGTKRFERTYNLTQQELLLLVKEKIGTNPYNL